MSAVKILPDIYWVGAVKVIDIEVIQPSLSFQYLPDEDGRKRCYLSGKEFVARIR